MKIFRQIDTLEKNRLEELYGVLMNFTNGQKEPGDWEKFTEAEKKGINEAIDEIDSGKGIPNENVMNNIRRKYSHA